MRTTGPWLMLQQFVWVSVRRRSLTEFCSQFFRLSPKTSKTRSKFLFSPNPTCRQSYQQNWRLREAATLAFGQILDGPTENMTTVVGQAMQVITYSSFSESP